jgi:hypothetical protein
VSSTPAPHDVDVDLTCHECDPPRRFDKPAALKGHTRWQHPTPLQDAGEECPPPPRRQGVPHQWKERLAILNAAPGRWRRWPYATRSPAYRAADRARTALRAEGRSDDYRIEAHHVDDHWWVYGVRQEAGE